MPAPITRSVSPFWFDQGGTLITGTDAITGNWSGITALTDCQFTAATTANLAGNWAGVQIKAGTTVHGRFTSIQLASGTAVAYR